MERLMRTLFLTPVLALALSAASLKAQPDGTEEMGRQAAARLVAESVLTDSAYDLFLRQLVLAGVFEDYEQNKAVKEARRTDEQKTLEAFVAAAKILLTNDMAKSGMAAAVGKMFSYDELKQILKFIRSDVGKRYTELATNPEFGEAFLQGMIKVSEDVDPSPALDKEFSRRFPSIEFDFEAEPE